MCTVGRIKSSKPYLLNDLLLNDKQFQELFINTVIRKGFDAFGSLLVFRDPNYGGSDNPQAFQLQKISATTIKDFLHKIQASIDEFNRFNLESIYFYGRATPETEDDSEEAEKLEHYIQPVQIDFDRYFLYHGLIESVKLFENSNNWYSIDEAFRILKDELRVIPADAPKVDTIVLKYLLEQHISKSPADFAEFADAIKGNYVFLIFNPYTGKEFIVNNILQVYKTNLHPDLQLLID